MKDCGIGRANDALIVPGVVKEVIDREKLAGLIDDGRSWASRSAD